MRHQGSLVPHGLATFGVFCGTIPLAGLGLGGASSSVIGRGNV